jgi:hypothetical protein
MFAVKNALVVFPPDFDEEQKSYYVPTNAISFDKILSEKFNNYMSGGRDIKILFRFKRL